MRRKNTPATAKQVGFIIGLLKQARDLGMQCRKIDLESLTTDEASMHIRGLKERIKTHKRVEAK